MSDEDLRDLERQVREGDEAARLALTSAYVRAGRGYLVSWDTESKTTFTKKGRRRYVDRVAVAVMVDQFKLTNGKPRKRPIKWRAWVLAVLDLADLKRVAGPRMSDEFFLLDAADGGIEFAPPEVVSLRVATGFRFRRYTVRPRVRRSR